MGCSLSFFNVVYFTLHFCCFSKHTLFSSLRVAPREKIFFFSICPIRTFNQFDTVRLSRILNVNSSIYSSIVNWFVLSLFSHHFLPEFVTRSFRSKNAPLNFLDTVSEIHFSWCFPYLLANKIRISQKKKKNPPKKKKKKKKKK